MSHRATNAAGSEGRTAALLAWYDRERRALPWRAAPGTLPDPYAVWLSEVMLQQTTVPAVIPYYARFLARWPTVAALARADLNDVLHAWQGLGYYARARNLHRAARMVAAEFGGHFPDSEEALRRLPGVGVYTAAAIAAIAFGRPAAAMDANAERVIARLFAVREPLPHAKPRLRALAQVLVPQQRPGDFAQALMDLGATVCLPARPRCSACPLRDCCLALAQGRVAQLPKRAMRRVRPVRYGAAYWFSDGQCVLLRRRPAEGLLGGLMQLPMSAWTEQIAEDVALRAQAPLPARWRKLEGEVRHGFTHFELVLSVWTARGRPRAESDGTWWPLNRLDEQALPTLVKKLVSFAKGRLPNRAAAKFAPSPQHRGGGGRQPLRDSRARLNGR
jgi:A/G-specific adenine glycosylase